LRLRQPVGDERYLREGSWICHDARHSAQQNSEKPQGDAHCERGSREGEPLLSQSNNRQQTRDHKPKPMIPTV